jgi:glucose uptake protein GlcU
MFRGMKAKDVAVLALTFTLCIVLVISMVGAVFFDTETGRIEELVAFLLGSIVTIVGEYVLLQLKFGKDDDKENK